MIVPVRGPRLPKLTLPGRPPEPPDCASTQQWNCKLYGTRHPGGGGGGREQISLLLACPLSGLQAPGGLGQP